jgi:hypothetical protein
MGFTHGYSWGLPLQGKESLGLDDHLMQCVNLSRIPWRLWALRNETVAKFQNGSKSWHETHLYVGVMTKHDVTSINVSWHYVCSVTRWTNFATVSNRMVRGFFAGGKRSLPACVTRLEPGDEKKLGFCRGAPRCFRYRPTRNEPYLLKVPAFAEEIVCQVLTYSF